jgi:hypothetical protein
MECKFKEFSDWNSIAKILKQRSKVNLFGNEPSDYDEIISKGADIDIFGRYTDIENLGSDIQFD